MKAGPTFVAKRHINVLIFLFLILTIQPLKAEDEKIVYHLHHTQENAFKRTINNIENLKKGMPDRTMDIKLLLQGNGIQLLFPSQQDKKLISRLLKLHDSGLDIEVAEKNYQANRLLIERSLKPRLVENIFSRLVELQHQGYSYLTP